MDVRVENFRQGQEKGSFGKDELKLLSGNMLFALESSSAVCVTYSQ